MIETLKIPIQSDTVKPFIKQGDTIGKIKMTITELGIDLRTSNIKMQVYNGSTRIIDVSDGDGITVISSTVLEIDEVSASNNNLPVGCFMGDFEITDASGERKTYFNVEYTIIKQYTR
jgi:hypothetical protein